MSANGGFEIEGAGFTFTNLVEERFHFLSELGFAEVESSPTRVLYRNGDIDVDVYHGRQSYEIGFGITSNGVRYSLLECINASDPSFAKQYYYPTATTQEGLAHGLTQTAQLVKRYCLQALQGDAAFLSILNNQRTLWSQQYSLDSRARQLRPKAHEAFRLGRYREAAELYKQFESVLSPTERKKLAVAKERSEG